MAARRPHPDMVKVKKVSCAARGWRPRALDIFPRYRNMLEVYNVSPPEEPGGRFRRLCARSAQFMKTLSLVSRPNTNPTSFTLTHNRHNRVGAGRGSGHDQKLEILSLESSLPNVITSFLQEHAGRLRCFTDEEPRSRPLVRRLCI